MSERSAPKTAWPVLSVVIPTLGRSTLRPTVESLRNSEGADQIEIIVAGRISDPGLRAQVASWVNEDPRIRHLDVAFEKGDSSEKKNAGWRAAKADLVAFLDDDVIVAPDWPKRVLHAFDDAGTALISGPGLVPPDAPLFPRLAGLALSSPAAGYVAWRYRHGRDELVPVNWSKIIGCNMAYRKTVLEQIGGFDPGFWPGEEMIASFRTQQHGHTLMFYPTAYVYHYPRQSLVRFWKQIFGYGATRIRLIRAGVEFEPTTVVPALWVAALAVFGIGALFSKVFAYLLAMLLISYATVALGITAMMVCESRRLSDAWLFFLIPVMHVSYGLAGWWEWIHPNRDLSVTDGF